jgi:hypothetical protein
MSPRLRGLRGRATEGGNDAQGLIPLVGIVLVAAVGRPRRLRRRATRRSRVPEARSSPRSCRSGFSLWARRSAISSSTAGSDPARASRRSRAGRSISAPRTRRFPPIKQVAATGACNPVGAVSDNGLVQRPGRAERPAPDRPRHREHLPRQDHELVGPADHASEPPDLPPRPQDHARVAGRRVGRHLRLHRLPLARVPGLEVDGRELDLRQLPDRRRRQGQRPASPGSSRTRPVRSATSRSPTV